MPKRTQLKHIMRVNGSIRLVRGKERFAVYNLKKGFCEPASLIEARLLSRLASGVNITPKSEDFSSRNFWAILSAMRIKGWLKKGKPKAVDINSIVDSAVAIKIPKKLYRVWIETTLACNLRCKHCYASSGPEVNRSKELSYKEWKAVICDLLDYGVENITFIGGEPTIRMDVVELGAALVSQNSPDTNIGIFTNLYNFGQSEKDIKFLKKYNLQVATSLYGLRGIDHDFMSTRIGSWRKSIMAIKNLIKNDIDVFVGFFKTSCNQCESEIKNWLKGIGVNRYDIQSHTNVGRAIEFRIIPKNISNQLPTRIYFPSSSIQRNSILHNCFSDHLAITPEGEVIGCIMMRKPIFGRLPSQKLIEVLRGDSFIELSMITNGKIDGCSVCEYRYACFDCRPAAISNSENLLEKPDCGYDPRMPLKKRVSYANEK